jgi:tetratricopeptide (TPR) repeat protein
LDLYKKGNFSAAKIICEQVLSKNARNFDALHLLGIIAAQEGKYSKASELLEKALTVNPNHIYALNNHANALQNLNRIDEAIEDDLA